MTRMTEPSWSPVLMEPPTVPGAQALIYSPKLRCLCSHVGWMEAQHLIVEEKWHEQVKWFDGRSLPNRDYVSRIRGF